MAEVIGYDIYELSAALGLVDSTLTEGEAIEITLCTGQLPSAQDVSIFYQQAVSAGHHVSPPVSQVISGIPTTSFTLRKGSPILPAILSLIPIIAIGGLITFGIAKIEDISKALLPLILVVTGGLVLVAAVMSKPATEVAKAYIEKRSPALVPKKEKRWSAAVAPLKSPLVQELETSITEEKASKDAYLKRSDRAIALNDVGTAELYKHIAEEEGRHAEEFGRRAGEVSELEYFADSWEQCSASVDRTGMRDQLNAAFTAAAQRVWDKKPKKEGPFVEVIKRLGIKPGQVVL